MSRWSDYNEEDPLSPPPLQRSAPNSDGVVTETTYLRDPKTESITKISKKIMVIKEVREC